MKNRNEKCICRSMTDLVSENSSVAQSPKRKFSFRFPNLSHHSSIDKDQSSASTSGHASNTNTLTYANRSRNFSEEIKNVPDLQVILTKNYFFLIQESTKFSFSIFVFDFFFHFFILQIPPPFGYFFVLN